MSDTKEYTVSLTIDNISEMSPRDAIQAFKNIVRKEEWWAELFCEEDGQHILINSWSHDIDQPIPTSEHPFNSSELTEIFEVVRLALLLPTMRRFIGEKTDLDDLHLMDLGSRVNAYMEGNYTEGNYD